MKRKAKTFRGAATEVVKEISRSGFARIVSETPIDTSLAVSNWEVTQGSKFSGLKGPNTISIKGSGALSARIKTVTSGYSSIESFKLGTTMYFTNNAPYIVTLNNGDLKHKPANMFAKGVQSMRARATTVSITRTMGKVK